MLFKMKGWSRAVLIQGLASFCVSVAVKYFQQSDRKFFFALERLEERHGLIVFDRFLYTKGLFIWGYGTLGWQGDPQKG